jgi:hypothetical protein
MDGRRTMTFEQLPGDRTRVTGVSVVDSSKCRDQIVKSGRDVGVIEGCERFDEFRVRMP